MTWDTPARRRLACALPERPGDAALDPEPEDAALNPRREAPARRAEDTTLDTLEDQKAEEDFVFSHFPTHGFKLRELELLRSVVERYDASGVLDGFVFAVNAEMEILESIVKILKDAGYEMPAI